MATLNLTSDPEVIWFVYPLIGWGIGIIAHFVFAIVLPKVYFIDLQYCTSYN